MNTLEAFEAIRRKHLRQNRDIINVQALKMKQLESEIGRLTVENLEIRSNNIALTEQILRERRLRGQDPNAEATKTTLRNVIKQLTNTLASYGGNKELRGIDEQLLTMLTPEPEGTKITTDEPMVKDIASQASASGRPVGKIVQRRPRPQITKELPSIFEAETEESEEVDTPSPIILMDLPRIIEPISMSDGMNAPLQSPAILSDEQLERLQDDLDMSSNFKRKSNIFAPPQDEEMKDDSSKSTKSSAGRKRKAPGANLSHGPRRRSGAGGDFPNGNHFLDSKENVDLSAISIKSAPTSPDNRERRNRKSVNYALPSLRVKMRREDPPTFPVAVGKVPEWSAKDFDKSRKGKGEKRDRSRSRSPSANEIIPRRESLSAPTTPRTRSLSPPASPTDTPTHGMLIDGETFDRDEIALQLDRRRKQRRESFQVVNGLGLIAAEEEEDVAYSDGAHADSNMYTTA